MSKDNVVLKSGIWYTVSNFLVRGIGFITTPIFTRILTQEEFGYFSNYLSWVSILTIIITLNVEATLISARYKYKDNLDEYIASVLSLGMLSTIIWCVIFNIFMEPIVELSSISPVYINSMFLYFFTLPAINLFQSRERFFYRYKVSVALSMLLSVGVSFIAVLLVLFMPDGLQGRIIGFVVPNFIIGMLVAVYLFSRGKRIKIHYWPEALKIVLPFIPHLLSLSILSMMDRIMITKICGERDNALYSLAYTVATIVMMVISALNSAFAPWIAEKMSEEKYSEIRKTSKIYMILGMYLTIGLMLLSPELLLFLGGKFYIEAKWAMIPISLSCICQFLYGLFVNVEQFKGKTVGMAFASASAAAINLVLNAWLIPIYGYVAASYTTLASYMWLLIVHMFLVYKMKLSEVYSYRFIFLALLGLAGVTVLMYILYNLTIARYVVVLVYGVVTLAVAYKNKEMIIKMLKK